MAAPAALRTLLCCTLALPVLAQQPQQPQQAVDPFQALFAAQEALEQTGTPLLPEEVAAARSSTLTDAVYGTAAALPTPAAASADRVSAQTEQPKAVADARLRVLTWRIWHRLLPTGLAADTSPAVLHPWLELLNLLKNPLQSDAQRKQTLAQWHQRYPAHPAQLIATHLSRLLSLGNRDRRRRFAVLLPQSGRLKAAGALVAAGIQISWFRLSRMDTDGRTAPELLFMDSTLPSEELVSRVLSEEVDVVIGPLDKVRAGQFMAAMQTHTSHPKTLLLNRLADEAGDTADPTAADRAGNTAFWQFGLPVEQEIASLVHYAKSRGLQRAGALMIDTQIGLRAGTALEDLWLDLDGEWIGTEIVSSQGEMTEAGKDLLLLDVSNRRAQLLQRVIGRRVYATPRPRQDLDVLFIAVPGVRGLEVTAALAYNYLKEVPLYSLASIYQPQEQINEFDLEGVQFMDMPWMVQPASQFGYADSFSGAKYKHRLLAFGIDVLAIALRIENDTLDSRLPHWGVTGLLIGNAKRQIEWAPVPVVVRRGLAQTLAP